MIHEWDRADELFSRALALPPELRARFLDHETRNDIELRAAVEDLLESAAAADEMLEGLTERAVGGVWDALATELEGGDADLVGERMGPFLLKRKIDRGGMGTVYLADRVDGQFKREVAVKVLRRGIDTDDVVRRFVAERQILASLSHPNIARLLDGGSTVDGRPYLVMEYVEGRPIDEYADAERLTIDARLTLFERVAEAVQFAHRFLVIHRDIKPSNILVDADGRPKLLDFGIAKLLDPRTDRWSVPRTRTGAHLVTPGYASPEQLTGAPPTTATDIYQLGLLLFKLLSGRDAWRTDPHSEPIEPPATPIKPSRAISSPTSPGERPREDAETFAAIRKTSVSSLERRLKGDLDTIVLTALQPEPARRYASVEHLLEDIRRHRSGLPIEALRDSMSYRASKFVARHRLSVAAAAAFIVLLAGYAVTVTLQARQIAFQRDRADLEAAKAKQVTEFVVGLFEVSDPTGADGDTVSARTLLDRGARRLEEDLSGQAEIRAAMLATIGRIYNRLGRYDLARPRLEQALADHRALHHGPHEDIVTDLMELASIRGREDAALVTGTLEEAVAVASEVYGDDHPLYAATLSDFGNHLTTIGEVERGTTLRNEAVQILRRADPAEAGRYLADALAQAAYGSSSDEALEWMREALEIRGRIFGDSSLQVARSLSDLGLALETRNPTESELSLRRSLTIHRRILGDRHTETLTILNNLAGVLRDRGDYLGAAPLYREVLAGRLEETPPATGVRLAFAMHGLGWTVAELGSHEEAEVMLREVVRILDVAESGLLGIARSSLGRCLALQQKYDEAEPHLVAGYAAAPDYLPVLERLVDLYDGWGRPLEAKRYRALVDEARRKVADSRD